MSRWKILAVLFTARTAMAFQFQSLAALSPFVIDENGTGLAEIGLLIGLYLAPGIVVAIPGSALSARFGDKRVVTAGLLMMTLGAALGAFSPGDDWLAASRLIGGAGGVLLNIVMTKMLIDWFAGREIATAMAIFINSWPVGIALASACLPLLAGAGGLQAGWWGTLALVVAGLAIFQLYRPAPLSSDVAVEPRALPWIALGAAGLVWAFYNAALAVVFSFGPALLTARGWTPESAGGVISLFMFVFAVFAPLGGVLSDRTGRRDLIIFGGCAIFIILLPLIPVLSGPSTVAALMLLAVISPLPAGSIMTLPGAVLSPPERAFGMGVFFTIYYGVMMAAPRIAGGAAERLADPSAAFLAGAVFAAVAIAGLGVFRVSLRENPAV